MKKSLIALAVLAASGASFAQSNATLYGKVDVWFGSVASTGQPTQTRLDDGGVGGSRWGVKGSEDLGGGLKANFLLETGFDATTGAGAGGMNRYSYVGFSGGFGEVKLGQVGTAYDDINGNGHDVFDSAVGSYVGVWKGYTGTGKNEIYYATNDYSGISGAVSYALGEDKTNALSASNVTSMHVKYAGGPLYVGLGYQQEKSQGSVTPDLKSTRVNASYDFGVAKLVGDVGHVSQGDASANQWTIGGYMPVSAALTLSAGYSKSTDNAAAGDAVRKGYALGAAYSLSKRTLVYAAYHNDTTTPKAGSDTTTKITAVGVQHNF